MARLTIIEDPRGAARARAVSPASESFVDKVGSRRTVQGAAVAGELEGATLVPVDTRGLFAWVTFETQ